MNQAQILIVEDEAPIRNLISTALKTAGYKYLIATGGETAILEAASHNPDVVLLDLGLPDIDGVEIIKKIRTWSNMPIIVISARSEDSDKVLALDAGADDYITKPFSVDELLARLRVTLRRSHYVGLEAGENDAVFQNGELKLDYAAGCVFLQNAEIHLTPMEYKLLCLMAKHVGRVLTHTFITREVWGSAWENDISAMRVCMATLRKKIEKNPSQPIYIQTHIGVGYRMLRV